MRIGNMRVPNTYLPLSILLMTLLVDEEGFLVINEDTIMLVSMIAYTIVFFS